MLRNGTFPGINKPTSKTALTKVIHVGHSFGSIQTYTLASMYPDISDGIVLTGFSFNMSFLDQFAFGSNLVQANTNPRFQMLPDGYLVPSDTQAMQTVFLYPGYFDPDMLALADATKQPVTVGELLSLFNVPMENQYKGPVLVITGGMWRPIRFHTPIHLPLFSFPLFLAFSLLSTPLNPLVHN